MNRRNVLVFPAGTEIGQEILNALKFCKEVSLFGAGEGISNHAYFSYPEYHALPSIFEEGWLAALILLCKRLDIQYIFPAHDDVIVALAREAEHIPAVVLSGARKVCDITRSKSETYRVLGDLVRVPRLFTPTEALDYLPVLIKPDRGQGSAGVKLVRTAAELERAFSERGDAIICEYLPGEEYTVDCLSDRALGLLFAGARMRRRMRNGISVNSVSLDLPEATGIARAISERLEMRGAWFFQLKRASSGELALLEVAPRIAGSMATHRVMGVNFPLLSIFEFERLPLKVTPNRGPIELDRALSNRYRHEIKFKTLYVDFDDTLIVQGKVNTELVKLIYQSINRGVAVKLLTRHAGNLHERLDFHRLRGLFDEVIHLQKGEKKSLHICERDAILVDDSHAERTDVALVCGIPTFDCSMIEVLTSQAETLPLDLLP